MRLFSGSGGRVKSGRSLGVLLVAGSSFVSSRDWDAGLCVDSAPGN